MIWLVAVLPAAGQSVVSVDLNDQAAEDLGINVGKAKGQLEDTIERELNLIDATKYLESFANADAIAMKGMGVDYATNPKKFSIGGSIGSGVADVPLSFVRDPTSLPAGGYAFMASAYAGVNLGVLTPGDDALDRFRLYVNGMAFSPPGNKSFKGSMKNFGVHAQVKLVGPVELKAVEWGGFDLTGGYERSFYQLDLSHSIPLSQKVSSAKVTWTATGEYTISSTAGTVPLELSTNFRLLVLTAYAGAGVDFDAAVATSSVSLSGPVDATVGGTTRNLGSGSVTVTQSGAADAIAARAFLGAQVNVTALKVFGQLNLGLNDAYGGFLGVRLAL